VAVSDDELDRAAAILRRGGLVAFPTETVYGLGANALDRGAVERIYAAKGRPSTSPLIVHIAGIEMLDAVVAEWPSAAQELAERFWPGPLTLVLKKNPQVPGEVTAGLNTVGIRMPAHPIASELIRRAGVPVAAPSANRFTGISPTTAEHVRTSLGDRVEMILDGGPTRVGIESTVLSLVEGAPMLLRPGMVSQSAIEAIVGPVAIAGPSEPRGPHASPGLHEKHYAPRTPFYILKPGQLPPAGRGTILRMPRDPERYAAALYAELHKADAEGWDWIAVEQPPAAPAWDAIRDRLRRAGRWAHPMERRSG
jgi:L-threonylcarbamoyladenylate synthase